MLTNVNYITCNQHDTIQSLLLVSEAILFQACAAGNFDITNMLTYAAEQVLGPKGVLEVCSK